MMELEDIEKLLENARFKHLAEATLISYRDNQLDKIGLALADAHLELCLICERRLTFLKEEAEAMDSYVITEEDRAAIQQSMRKLNLTSVANDILSTEIQRLTSYIRDLVDAWIVPFGREAMLGTGDGDEIWRYESEDGLLIAWAIFRNEDASLVVHFSSSELAWEGARIRFRLGPFTEEVTLQREGDSNVAAKITIPRRERAKNMADISIEIL